MNPSSDVIFTLIDTDEQAALTAIDALLRSSDTATRTAGAYLAGQIKSSGRLLYNLLPLVADPDEQIRIEAVVALEKIAVKPSPEIKRALFEGLAELPFDPLETVRVARVRLLARLHLPDAYRALLPALTDPSSRVVEAAVDCLAASGDLIIPLLESARQSENFELSKRASRVLCHIHPEVYAHLIDLYIEHDLSQLYDNHRQLAALASYQRYNSARILSDTLREYNQALLDDLFYLLRAVHDPASVQDIAAALADPAEHARALDALERLTGARIAGEIAHLFIHDATSADHARRVGHTDLPTIYELIRDLFYNTTDEWLRAAAVYFVNEAEGALSAQERYALINAALADSSLEVRHAGISGVSEIGEIVMLSRIEKVIFLKQATLFVDLSMQQLQRIADICEEALFEQGDILFAQGAASDSMYVIVNGQVGVDQQSADQRTQRIATRQTHDTIGEMALFDAQPRPAAAVALTDTLALRLASSAFTRLARQQPDLALALLRSLSLRLRGAYARLAEVDSTSAPPLI